MTTRILTDYLDAAHAAVDLACGRHVVDMAEGILVGVWTTPEN